MRQRNFNLSCPIGLQHNCDVKRSALQLPPPSAHGPGAAFFYVRAYMFFCFQSSSACLYLFRMLRTLSFPILFFDCRRARLATSEDMPVSQQSTLCNIYTASADSDGRNTTFEPTKESNGINVHYKLVLSCHYNFKQIILLQLHSKFRRSRGNANSTCSANIAVKNIT
jgi:hypothetical protein